MAQFWEKVDPGTLKKRVTFYRPVEEEDDYGNITNGVESVCEVWADIYPVRGQEFYEVQKIQGKVTHKCYCRYQKTLEDIDNTWFLLYKDTLFSIESAVNAGEAGRYFEIYCTKHTDKEEMPYGDPSGGDDGTDQVIQ